MINRYNRKQEPIPVVPRTMRIVNADGTVTRSGQLLLEQLQNVGISGPYIRTLDLFDVTPGAAIAPFVPIYQPGPAVRAIGVLRLPISADLVIAISRNDETTPLFTFTFPAGTATATDVVMDLSHITFEDLDVLIPSILASDSSSDTDGIATLTIEWIPFDGATSNGSGGGGNGTGTGPAGPQGPPGPEGPTGPEGPPGPIIPATATVLGGVKIGANVNVQPDGTISVAGPPPISTYQTPWLQDIDGAEFNLNNAGHIGVGTAATTRALTIQSGIVNSFDIAATNTSPLATLGTVLQNDQNDLVQFGLGGSLIPSTNLRRMTFLLSTRDVIFGVGASLTERMRLTVTGLGIGLTAAYPLDVAGDVNITGVYRVNGVPISTGSQTPWLSDIDGANHTLDNIAAVLFRSPSGGDVHALGAALFLRGDTGVSIASGAGQMTIANGYTYNYQFMQVFGLFKVSSADNTIHPLSVLESGLVGINNEFPAYAMDIVGDCNITGEYRVNGVPVVVTAGVVEQLAQRVRTLEEKLR
jgi:hypothetical protein